MTIPVYLIVAQWAVLFALAFLVIVMYRQLGRYFDVTKPTSTPGPEVGSGAARFDYSRVREETVRHFTPGDDEPALIAFVDPTCPACEELVAALGDAVDAGDLAGIHVLLLISEPPSYLAVSETFRTTSLELGRVLAHTTLDAYGVSATPLLVALDAAGVIKSAGSVTEPADIRAFAAACLSTVVDDGPTLPIVS